MKKGKNMKCIFRGVTLFDFDPEKPREFVVVAEGEEAIWKTIPNVHYFRLDPEDYKLLAEFFTRIHRYTEGDETVDVTTDIILYRKEK
jgi:hypothetical protein